MKAITVNTESQIEEVNLDKPQIGPNEALVKTKGCGICGTDLLKINLNLLQKQTVLGHELVGNIEAIGKNVTEFNVGDLIISAHHVPCFKCHYCNHENFSMCTTFKETNFEPGGFSEYVKLSTDHLKHTTFKIPEDMPWQEAVFTEPLACLVRNNDRLPLQKHDCVVIVGLGSIGLMMAKLLRRMHITIIGIDIDEERCKNALNYGVDFVFSNTDEDFLTTLKNNTGNRLADGIIFTAGPASLLNKSFSWTRNGGFINLFCHLSGEKAEIDTAELYHRELQLITTYSPSPDALRKSFEILRDENLNLRQMFKSYQPHEFQFAIDEINNRKILKALVEFS